MQGGAAQGIGWALNEEYIYDADGVMENAGFLDYRVPVASDLPMIDTQIIEVPNPTHPYGVRGVGETPIVAPLATVANAVRDATGLRIGELPLSPPRVLEAPDAAAGQSAPLARVFIPDHLASVTGGVREVEVIATTYRELVQKLDELYPGAAEAIMGKVAVAIDGDIIHDALLDPLEADSEVCFLHRIEGG